MIEYQFAGRTYYFLLSGNALFTLYKLVGYDLMAPITGNDFPTICNMAAVMAESGELSRRIAGHDHQPILSADTLQKQATAREAIELRDAITKAIVSGLEIEVQPKEEVDLDLVEYNKSKKNI